jgi:hypothetical protein
MRQLIYVPIIHTADTDLGSLAPDVEEKATQLLGERWERHKKIVEEYWEEIGKYFETRNLTGVKIFQDALPIGGKEAEIIIDKLAQNGSPNYRLLKKFVSQGAILLMTEDIGLLKQEYQLAKELMLHKSLFRTILALLNYKFKKARLLESRDRYIAKQINQNLNEAETSVCFLGAYHQVLPKLSKGINVIRVKRPGKIREYYRKLIGNTEMKEVNHLADYLRQPVKKGVLGNYD